MRALAPGWSGHPTPHVQTKPFLSAPSAHSLWSPRLQALAAGGPPILLHSCRRQQRPAAGPATAAHLFQCQAILGSLGLLCLPLLNTTLSLVRPSLRSIYHAPTASNVRPFEAWCAVLRPQPNAPFSEHSGCQGAPRPTPSAPRQPPPPASPRILHAPHSPLPPSTCTRPAVEPSPRSPARPVSSPLSAV